MMNAKSTIKYASVDVQHSKDVVETNKKVSRKAADSKSSKGRRSQSLDRTLDDNSGDSREERRNRRQFMHLVRRTQNKIIKKNIPAENYIEYFIKVMFVKIPKLDFGKK